MSAKFEIDYSAMDRLIETVQNFQEGAEKKITTYLHGKGYEKFEKAIHNAMPVSGKKWKNKKPAAKPSKSIQDKNKKENIAVTIKSTTKYGYLYFPDDGSNTLHHYGNQRFFEKGVDSETEAAVNDMIELLIKEV